MLVLHEEAKGWRWYRPLFNVYINDTVLEEFYRYEDCSLLEMIVLLRYYRKRGAKIA